MTRKLKKVPMYRCEKHGVGVRKCCEEAREIKLPDLYSFGNDKDNFK